MNSKVRNLIILLLVLLIVIVVIWAVVKRSSQRPPSNDTEQVISPPSNIIEERETIQENLTKQIEGKSEEEISDQAAVLKATRYFVERYGSFSSQARWQNLQDLKNVVTDNLWQDFEDLLSKDVSSSKYYSLSTKVLSLNVISLSPNKAKVVASTQRREVKGGEENISYRKMEVSLVKVGDKWLVSSFEEKL